MKFTLSWLKEHLDTTASRDEIKQALTRRCLEGEGITDPAQSLKGFGGGDGGEQRAQARERSAAAERGAGRDRRQEVLQFRIKPIVRRLGRKWRCASRTEAGE